MVSNDDSNWEAAAQSEKASGERAGRLPGWSGGGRAARARALDFESRWGRQIESNRRGIMKVLALTLILISTSLAGSDETFQMDNAVGLWKTLDYPFATSELLITADEGGKTLSLVYCNINTEFTGKCEQVYTYTGKISYSAQGDNLLVEKGPSSPTPKYEMQIFKGPSLMRMKRSWGSQTIGYFKIK